MGMIDITLGLSACSYLYNADEKGIPGERHGSFERRMCWRAEESLEESGLLLHCHRVAHK
jgi:hypothetical protein